jgi:hypothetical protein
MTAPAEPLFRCFDDAFSIHLSRTYNLSILVGWNKLSFCFNRHDDNSLVGIESYRLGVSEPQMKVQNDAQEWCSELALLLRNLEALKKPFRRVCIAVDCHKTTLIPAELFCEGNQEEFLQFNHQMAEFEICRHENLPRLNAEIIYALPACIVSVIQSVFPEAEIMNSAGQLIEKFIKLSQEQANDGMLYANVSVSSVEVFYTENGKLRYFNSFQYRTREDMAYYIIFIMEQLGLNPDTISLMLMGDIERESDRFELLYKYIRNIRLMDDPILKVSKQMAEIIPVSGYYKLLSLAKCV